MNVEVVLGGLVLAREESGAEDSERAKPFVGEYDVAAEVVPAHEIADDGDTTDSFRLAVANSVVRGSVDLDGTEPRPHRSSRSRTTASSGLASSKQGEPEGQLLAGGENPRRLTRWW